MSNSITLSASQRTNIATLKDITSLSNRTAERLTSGKKINTVADGPVGYFVNQSLQNRADDFKVHKDYIDQGISSLTAALNATQAIDEVLSQMKGLAEAAKAQSQTERVTTTEQFETLGTQISKLVEDASYNGYNLLSEKNNNLTVKFSDKTGSSVVVGAYDFNSTTAGDTKALFGAANAAYNAAGNFVGISILMGDTGFERIGDNNTLIALVETTISGVNTALSNLRAASNVLGSNVALLKTRLDFTDNYAQTLSVGGDKLTLADMNEEGANLTALQTRQQLGIQSLAVSGTQARSVLTLVQ